MQLSCKHIPVSLEEHHVFVRADKYVGPSRLLDQTGIWNGADRLEFLKCKHKKNLKIN